MTTESVPTMAGGIPPAGLTGEVLQKVSNDDFAVAWGPGGGGGGGNNNGTTLALSHHTGLTGAPVDQFNLFNNVVLTKNSAGNYTVALTALTFADADDYTIHVTLDNSASALSFEVDNRTATGFDILVVDAAGTPTDASGVNIIVSGDPQLAPPNRVVSPVGLISWFGASTPPVTWLECNGAAISRTTYGALFAVIGTTYGNGDGSLTFNLPDLRGEFIRGWDNGRGVDSGRVFGSDQNDAFKSHKHNFTLGGSGNSRLSTTYFERGSLDATGPMSGDAYMQNTGGAETRPRNVALLPCIKALPDFGDYAAVQAVESYTVTNPVGQTVFNTVNLNVNYCYVFVDGAYQPPTEYTVNTDTQITFSTTLAQSSTVDFVKIYVATTPAASAAQVLADASTDTFLTPGNLKHSLRAAKKIVRFTGRTSDGTCTINLNFGGTARVQRLGLGRYRLLWSSSGSGDNMGSNNYAVSVTVQGRQGDAYAVGSWNDAISVPSNIDMCEVIAQDSTGIILNFESTASNKQDPKYVEVVVFGQEN